ncbi:MAG: hypothetical protein ACQES4_05605 [Bacillota bacterium]
MYISSRFITTYYDARSIILKRYLVGGRVINTALAVTLAIVIAQQHP